jgi:hypothetical protein
MNAKKVTVPPAEVLAELLAEFDVDKKAFRRLLLQTPEFGTEVFVDIDEELVRLQGGRVFPVEMV